MPSTDVLYVRFHFAALVAAVVAFAIGKPVVLEVNGAYADLFLAWPSLRRLSGPLVSTMRAQLRLADRVIAVTPQLAAWANRQGSRCDSVVIQNGVDIALFYPRSPDAVPAGPPRVSFVGVLAPWQGIREMLEATREPAWPEDTRLTIAGGGPLAEHVSAEALVNPRVEYLGVLPFENVPDLLRTSIAALSVQSAIPRNVEGGLSPIKLYEAMATGIPVIVADVGGLGGFVGEAGCGIVVPPAGPAGIADAVRTLRYDPDLASKLGSNGRNAAVASHSWDDRVKATASLIRAAISAAAE